MGQAVWVTDKEYASLGVLYEAGKISKPYSIRSLDEKRDGFVAVVIDAETASKLAEYRSSNLEPVIVSSGDVDEAPKKLTIWDIGETSVEGMSKLKAGIVAGALVVLFVLICIAVIGAL